jgi:chromosome segregation ATPase
MGIGGTAKKLQKVAEMGEELYTRINDLRAQVSEMRETVTATHDRVDRLESEVAEQRAILEALAQHEGIDVDALVAEAHISQAESTDDADGSDGDEGRDRPDAGVGTDGAADDDRDSSVAGTGDGTAGDTDGDGDGDGDDDGVPASRD